MKHLQHSFKRTIDIFTFRFQSLIYLGGKNTLKNKFYICQNCNYVVMSTSIYLNEIYKTESITYQEIDISCEEYQIKKLLE